MGTLDSLDPVVVSLAVIAVSVLLFYYPWFERRMRRMPAGPHPLPLIGSLHILGNEPHKSLGALAHKYGAIMSFRMGTADTIVVSSGEAAKLFVKTHDMKFATRAPMTGAKNMLYEASTVAFAPYGEHWKRMRRIFVNMLLSAKSLESFRQVREHHVSLLMQRIWQDSKQGTVPVDLSDAIYNTLYELVWATVDRNSVLSEELKHLPRQIIQMSNEGSLYDLFPFLEVFEPVIGIKRRMKKAWKSFDSFADKVIADHAAQDKPHNSFVGLLLEISKQDESLTKDNIKAIMIDLFVGGSYSSAITMEWTVSNLLKKPECYKRARKEVDEIFAEGAHNTFNESHIKKMEYLRWVLKETLRMNPLAAFPPPHEAMEDTVVGDYRVAKGTSVMINVWAIGRDEKVWEKAEDFMPERYANEEELDMTGQSDFKSLPFGAGRRGCPGHNTAIQIILLIVGTLLHTFDLSVEGDPSELDMTVATGAGTALIRMHHLYVLPKLRNNRI